MLLKEWRETAGLTTTQFARNVGDKLGREITADHVTAWERGSMPGWDAGEAIRALTGGNVAPKDFSLR
jgi:hypothetical protein